MAVFYAVKFTQSTWLVSKVYAGDMSPENRQLCGEATEPLLEAVDNLVTYASSPEFASVPAKISSQVFRLIILFPMSYGCFTHSYLNFVLPLGSHTNFFTQMPFAKIENKWTPH